MIPIALLLNAQGNDVDDSVYELSPITITAGTVLVSKESIENLSGRSHQIDLPGVRAILSESIDSIGGVHMQRRGANALEPNIRGQGGDRVKLYWNGLYLPNASPTQTASPLNYFGAGSVDLVRVASSSAQVVLGSPNQGASIDLINQIEKTGGVSGGVWLDEGRDGYSGFVEWSNAYGKTGYKASVNTVDLGDYTAGTGEIVDADYRAEGMTAMYRFFDESENELNLNAVYHRIDLSRNSSLPLDTRDSELFAFSLRQELQWPNSDWSIRNRIGFSQSSPKLDNRDRVGSPILVEARADTRTFTAGTLVELDHSENMDLVAGLDFAHEARNATRFRHTPKGILDDRLWPNLFSRDIGAFVRSDFEINDACELRVGVRLDRHTSEAKDLGATALANGTLMDNLLKFHSNVNVDTKLSDWLGSVNATLATRPSENTEMTFGLAWTRTSPSATQRYRGFVNALGGGFELGNPSLSAEESFQFNGRIDWHYQRLQASLTAFYQHIDDYVHRIAVGSMGPNKVYSFKNVDGHFYGMEFDARLKPFGNGSLFSVPLGLAVVDGRNRNSDQRFAEVPPLEGRIGLRIDNEDTERRLWGELDVRFATSRRNPEPDLVPIFEDSSSYATLDLRAGIELSSNLQLELDINNLLDRAYYHYLQPLVTKGSILPSSGNLMPGDRIPAAGRSLVISLSWKK